MYLVEAAAKIHLPCHGEVEGEFADVPALEVRPRGLLDERGAARGRLLAGGVHEEGGGVDGLCCTIPGGRCCWEVVGLGTWGWGAGDEFVWSIETAGRAGRPPHCP
jgi:hypothetical protein